MTRPSTSTAEQAIPRIVARCARASADSDTGLGSVDGLHALGDPHGLFDQGLHDLRLGHGLDDLALDEDLALAVARRRSEVGLAGLPRTVHDAAHHRDPQGYLEPVQAGGDRVGELVDVDLRASARRTRDDLES